MDQQQGFVRASGLKSDRQGKVDRWKSRASLLAALGLVAGLQGCAALIGAGAGAAGGIAYTQRGVKGEVKGEVVQVRQDAEAVFKNMGIRKTGSEMKRSGEEQRLTGQRGETEVNVVIRRAGKDVSTIEVEAQDSPLQWNKDLARNVLNEIVRRG